MNRSQALLEAIYHDEIIKLKNENNEQQTSATATTAG